MERNHFLVDSLDTCSQTAVVLQVDILVPHALAPSRPFLAQRREGDRGSLFTATQSATLCSSGICVYWRSASRMGYFGPSPLECYLWSACLPETIVPRPTNLIAVPLRAYLFLINTYKYSTRQEMYLYVLIRTKCPLSCTYFTLSVDKMNENTLKIVPF